MSKIKPLARIQRHISKAFSFIQLIARRKLREASFLHAVSKRLEALRRACIQTRMYIQNLPLKLLAKTLILSLISATLIILSILVLIYLAIEPMLSQPSFSTQPNIFLYLPQIFIITYAFYIIDLSVIFLFDRFPNILVRLSSYKALQENVRGEHKGLARGLALLPRDENLRLVFREVCEREVTAPLRAPRVTVFSALALFVAIIILAFFKNPVASSLLDRAISGVLNNPVSVALALFAGVQLYIEWSRYWKETALPAFSIYELDTASMPYFVLKAVARNTSKLEYLIEGEYRIPPYEQGRVLMRRRGERLRKPQLLILPERTASLELYLEPVEKSDSCREKSGGMFALLSLRFISHERRGPFRSLLRSFYSILTEEPRRVRNLVLVCYLDPQAGRAEVVYELP